jgi:hypothetical protein
MLMSRESSFGVVGFKSEEDLEGGSYGLNLKDDSIANQRL